MAGKQVEFHEAASEEMEGALSWYLDRGEQAALLFQREIEVAVASIAAAPHRFPIGVKSTRRFLLRRFPFAIIYRELPSIIQILAVAHGIADQVTGKFAPSQAVTRVERVLGALSACREARSNFSKLDVPDSCLASATAASAVRVS